MAILGIKSMPASPSNVTECWARLEIDVAGGVSACTGSGRLRLGAGLPFTFLYGVGDACPG
jgi:hypothetical protein